jgi:hypothetical protein
VYPRFALEPQAPAAVASARRPAGAVEKSVGATQRFFHRFGRWIRPGA